MSSINTSGQMEFTGLTDEEVQESRSKYGRNVTEQARESGFVRALKDLFQEPMFLLLLVASGIYFFIGDVGDGLFLMAAILLVAAISLYQESRSRNALAALRAYIQPRVKVYRNGELVEIPSEEIVMNDVIMAEEGSLLPSDGVIIRANDFQVNESILTGESLPVYKREDTDDNQVFHGTQVTGGLAIVRVTAIGNQTQLARIGKSLEAIKEEPTPLQRQIKTFVRQMAVVGLMIFVLVWGINYFQSYDLPDSLLKALTLAMSILPEEIPVAFTTFMALGAWRMMKTGVIAKQMRTVEALGSATVICVDKTGTITENKMKLERLYLPSSDQLLSVSDANSGDARELIALGMWSSEPIPFDPMEKALHEAYAKYAEADLRGIYRMVHEYPLSGRPPMMTHIFEDPKGHRIIAAKGAPEALMDVSELTGTQRQQVEEAVLQLSREGYRVLAVGVVQNHPESLPAAQQDLHFEFKGLLAFYDPPKKNMKTVFDAFYRAGIDVKIITGDNAETTTTIANQVGFRHQGNTISGDTLLRMDQQQLEHEVMNIHLFTRMFPEAKLRILNALKAAGQVVAMTGDGVNDAPALKAAHIGIAMGDRGAEIARQASSLIITDDDLSKMVEAIAMGRKIYTNLKKAIQYIISIHIPIILTVFLPLVLGWVYPAIFSPVHVIFLELIMGPTCSIIYENEPMENNTLEQKPRPFTLNFFNWSELNTSIIQGMVITLGVLCMYQLAVSQGANEAVTRTMVFTTLITANIFLTLVNRSFYYSIITTLRYRNPLVPMIIVITMLLTGVILSLHPLTMFFGFESLTMNQLGLCIGTGFLSAIWFEAVKLVRRMRFASQNA